MSKGQPLGNCKACGSEIVDTVNEGVFRNGECDACEYQRYRTQPALLKAAQETLQAVRRLNRLLEWAELDELEPVDLSPLYDAIYQAEHGQAS